MRSLDEIVALRPSDTVELRVIRRYVRKTAGQAASEWLGDALMGSDSGPSDAPVVRIAELHWLTAAGATVPIVLNHDERVQPDDLAVLVCEARRSGIRFAIWSETGSPRQPAMTLETTWFCGADVPPPVQSPKLLVERNTHGVTVTIEESQPRQPWWLMMIPALILSFAWLFFLVVGGLPRMIRDIWQRGVVGLSQQTVAELDTHELRVRAQRNRKIIAEVTTGRAGLAAVSTANGLTAYTETGAVVLPSDWATPDAAEQLAIRRHLAHQLNREIGAL